MYMKNLNEYLVNEYLMNKYKMRIINILGFPLIRFLQEWNSKYINATKTKLQEIIMKYNYKIYINIEIRNI